MHGTSVWALRLGRALLAMAAGVFWGLLGIVLALAEPLVRIVLVPLAYLSFLVTVFFGFVVNDPRFPRWGMLAFSVGSLALYGVYIAVMNWVQGSGNGRD